MCSSDLGDSADAVRHARLAQGLAAATDSARHRVKSDVVAAAALCSAGQLDAARTLGEAALAATGELNLVPLRWAVACLLADIGSPARSPQQLTDLRDAAADEVTRRGGAWRIR